MEYQALYRKYRPQSFEEVIGQSHITTTLAREVAEGRVAHAYLFAGPRGTGKTTTARVLAKALNCENLRPDGGPDNACQNCLAITEGSSLDVLELDAASHNSVEDIRDMRVSVSTVAAATGGRRVFILDEAHMLSKAAGNALLKTLEEPPEHVHFVLATTEPYKLADTIRSRAQRFDFHPVPLENIVNHLRWVSEAEGYRADQAALTAVARHALGSVRDALSLLEQVAALGDRSVEVGGVNRALGLADRDSYGRLISAMAGRDAKAALELVAEIASRGADLRRFVGESIAYLRGVFLAHYAPNLAEVADEPREVLDDWRRAAKQLPAGEVLRAVDLLGEALVKLREGREERLMVELAVIKLTRPETAVDGESVAARLDRLEQRFDWLSSAPAQVEVEAVPERVGAARSQQEERKARGKPPDAPAAVPAREQTPSARPSPARPAAPELPPPPDLTIGKVETIWPALLSASRQTLGPRRGALLREAIPAAVEAGTIIFSVPHEFHLAALRQDPSVASAVAAKAGELLGGSVRVDFRESAVETVEDVEFDKDRLFEGAEDDPVALVRSALGAEVVEDVEN